MIRKFKKPVETLLGDSGVTVGLSLLSTGVGTSIGVAIAGCTCFFIYCCNIVYKRMFFKTKTEIYKTKTLDKQNHHFS